MSQKRGRDTDAVREAVTLFTDRATAMLEGSDKPDVIVAALPFDLIMRVVNDVAENGDDEAVTRGKRLVVLIEQKKGIAIAVGNESGGAGGRSWGSHLAAWRRREHRNKCDHPCP